MTRRNRSIVRKTAVRQSSGESGIRASVPLQIRQVWQKLGHRTWPWALSLGVLGFAVLLPLSAQSTAAQAAADKATDKALKGALSVSVAQPQMQTWASSLTANGGLYAWQEAIVASELGGIALSEVRVDVGTPVKRGQVLARLAPATLQAALAARQAAVAQAQAALAEAQASAQRAEKVKDSGALSAQQIQQLQLAAESARAALQAAVAMQQLDEVRLNQTVIRAVDDGVISARNATLGAVVQPGMELFRLVRQNRVEWRAELTAEQLLQVRPGMPALLKLSDGQQIKGKVRMLAPALDALSRKALAYVDLAAGSAARAGMYAQGEIQLGSSQALTIPGSALLLRDGNSYVFTVAANGQVKQGKVITGRRQNNAVEILDGMAANVQVVTRGAAFLNDGDFVHVVADVARGTAPAAAAKTAAGQTIAAEKTDTAVRGVAAK